MPRQLSKHAPAKVVSTIRQREAAELRAQKLTLQEIGDKMGISKSRVGQLLEAWDESFKCENAALAEQIREAQLDEIRLLKSEWFMRVKDQNANAKDLQAYMKMLDHEAALVGAKAAAKTELTGANGGPLQSVAAVATTDLSNLSTEDLEALERLLAAATPKGP